MFSALDEGGATPRLPLPSCPVCAATCALQPLPTGAPLVLSSSRAACRGVTFCYMAGSTCCRVAVDTRSLGRDLLGSSACRAGTREQRHSTRQAASGAANANRTHARLLDHPVAVHCSRLLLLLPHAAAPAARCLAGHYLPAIGRAAAHRRPQLPARRRCRLRWCMLRAPGFRPCCLRLPLALSHASRCGAAGAPSPHRGARCSRVPASRVALPTAACRAEPAHRHGSYAAPQLSCCGNLARQAAVTHTPVPPKTCHQQLRRGGQPAQPASSPATLPRPSPSRKPLRKRRCTTLRWRMRPVPVVLRPMAFTLQLSAERRAGGAAGTRQARRAAEAGVAAMRGHAVSIRSGFVCSSGCRYA